jgi:hypothetical protein
MLKSTWNKLVLCVLVLAVGVLLVSVAATILSTSSQPQMVEVVELPQPQSMPPNIMWVTNGPASQGMLPHIIGFANVSTQIQGAQPNVMWFTVAPPPPQVMQANNMMFTNGPPQTLGSEWLATSGAVTISYAALIAIIVAVAVISSTAVYLIRETIKHSTKAEDAEP